MRIKIVEFVGQRDVTPREVYRDYMVGMSDLDFVKMMENEIEWIKRPDEGYLKLEFYNMTVMRLYAYEDYLEYMSSWPMAVATLYYEVV